MQIYFVAIHPIEYTNIQPNFVLQHPKDLSAGCVSILQQPHPTLPLPHNPFDLKDAVLLQAPRPKSHQENPYHPMHLQYSAQSNDQFEKN